MFPGKAFYLFVELLHKKKLLNSALHIKAFNKYFGLSELPLLFSLEFGHEEKVNHIKRYQEMKLKPSEVLTVNFDDKILNY